MQKSNEPATDPQRKPITLREAHEIAQGIGRETDERLAEERRRDFEAATEPRVGYDLDAKCDREAYCAQSERERMEAFMRVNELEQQLASAKLWEQDVRRAERLRRALSDMLCDYEGQYGENYCECDSSVGLTCNACHARAVLALEAPGAARGVRE